MITTVKDFVKGCAVYQWVKDINALPQGELAPLPVPESHFDMWTMDFVTGFPLDGGLNGLMVCIDKLTQLTRLIPCLWGNGPLMRADQIAQGTWLQNPYQCVLAQVRAI